MNKLSDTPTTKSESQLRHWSLAIALAQIVCFASLWLVPLHVAWFVAFLQVLHMLCFFFYKGARSWADGVTLFRGVLTAFASFIALSGDTITAEIWLMLLAALLLDGVDGYIARKTQTASPEGAIFDMETDGIWVSLMCLNLVHLGIEPTWILMLGLWRPVYVLVSSLLPKVVETHPKGTFFGKAVFVTVAVVLLVASSPWRVLFLTQILLALACVLLSVSFLKSIVEHVRELKAPKRFA